MQVARYLSRSLNTAPRWSACASRTVALTNRSLHITTRHHQPTPSTSAHHNLSHLRLYTQISQPTTAEIVERHKDKARKAGSAGDWQTAKTELTRALELAPNDTQTVCALAALHRELGDVTSSIEVLTAALERNPTDLILLSNRAGCFVMDQQPQKALEDCNTILKSDSDHFSACANKGAALFLLKEYSSAIDCLTHAIKLKEDTGIYRTRGLCFAHTGAHELALADFLIVQQHFPDEEQLQFNIANTRLKCGDHIQALGDFTKLLEKHPNDIEVIVSRAICHHFAEQYQESLDDINRALALDNKCLNALTLLSAVNNKLERYEESISAATRALEVDDQCVEALNNRGRAYMLSTMLNDAINDFTRAIELQPDMKMALCQRAQSYGMLGEYHSAIADFDAVLAIDPNDHDALVGKKLAQQNLIECVGCRYN